MKQNTNAPVTVKDSGREVTITIAGKAYANLKKIAALASRDSGLNKSLSLGEEVSAEDMAFFLSSDLVGLDTTQGCLDIMDRLAESREKERNRLLAEMAFA